MPTTWVKDGVMGDLHPVMQKCKGRIIRLYYSKGLDFFVTSIKEGNHQPGSFHPIGYAMDFKRQGVAKSEIVEAAGQGFDVVEYSDNRDIFHVEWDVWKGKSFNQ